MHIFLTGDIQVGKTTIIRKFIEQSGLSADGFITYWEGNADGSRSLYLSSYSADVHSVKRYLVARDAGSMRAQRDNITRIFDARGCDILSNAGKRDVIIMDELGFLESGSLAFREAVMERISGDVPVLGVIKPAHSEFLDGVRAHPSVIVREVSAETRDAEPAWLLAQQW